MKEFKFIELLKPSSVPSPEGIGDDAAVVGDLLISMDIMAQGTHFTFEEPVEDVINHLLVSNLSDMAAMGGKVGGYKALMGVSVPEKYDKVMISKALSKLTKQYDITLIGGDTVTAQSDAFFALTIIGHKNEKVLTRHSAQKGDIVFVSRPLGAGKYSLQRKSGVLGGKPDIHYQLEAETALGELLGSVDGVTACIDISDGLGLDLSHIANNSGVKIILDRDKIPVAKIHIPEKDKLEFALSSGEEYALAFTVSADKADAVEKEIKEKLKRDVYRIGVTESGDRCWIRKKDGTLADISRIGYEHR